MRQSSLTPITTTVTGMPNAFELPQNRNDLYALAHILAYAEAQKNPCNPIAQSVENHVHL